MKAKRENVCCLLLTLGVWVYPCGRLLPTNKKGILDFFWILSSTYYEFNILLKLRCSICMKWWSCSPKLMHVLLVKAVSLPKMFPLDHFWVSTRCNFAIMKVGSVYIVLAVSTHLCMYDAIWSLQMLSKITCYWFRVSFFYIPLAV